MRPRRRSPSCTAMTTPCCPPPPVPTDRIVTASGSFLAPSGDNTARIWDAVAAKEIAVLRGHDGCVYSAAFSPDGARIVTAAESSNVALGGRTADNWGGGAGNERD